MPSLGIAMRLNLPKLPKAKAAELESFPLESAEPYRPLPAPIYVLLAKNEKLVSLRGPFDFLNPRDLLKMKSGGMYFYGPLLSRVEPFLVAARDVKKILEWNKPSATQVLEPSPFEISDAVLRRLSSLWAVVETEGVESEKRTIGIESYFAVAFANELCDPIPGDRLEQARDKDPDLYETALLRAGVFVFLALHLGYLDLNRLSELRRRFFDELIQATAFSDREPISMELAELKRWTENLIHSPDIHLLTSEFFEHSISRVSQKLKSRLFRVREELVDPTLSLARSEESGESEVGDVG